LDLKGGKMRSKTNKHSRGSSLIGIIIIAIGLIWLLNNLDFFDFHINEWWPLILIIIGLIILANNHFADPGGWIMLLLGGAFLLTTNDILEWEQIWDYWPLILIIIGLSIIFPGHRFKKTSNHFNFHNENSSDFSGFFGKKSQSTNKGEDKDNMSFSTAFSSLKKRINDKHWKGGSVSAVFSSMELDLRSAELHEKGAFLEISSVFSSAEIFIPQSWNVEIHPEAVLGSFENKCSNKESSGSPRLVIKATAVFGSIEVRN
jgi:predicted membrane protein